MGIHNNPPISDSRWIARFLVSGKPSKPSEVSIHTLTCACVLRDEMHGGV